MLCFPTPGGSGVVAVELARELARRGHELHLVSHAMPFRLEEGGGVCYHEVPLREFSLFPYPLFSMEVAAKLVAVLNECSPQLIHVHYALPYSITALLARSISGQDQIKLVTTIHGTDITTWGQDKAMQPLIRHGLENSDAVTSVSYSLRRDAVALLSMAEEQISVIYNFIDTDRCQGYADMRLKRKLAPHGERIILHISNFRPVKRVPDLIHAFSLLIKEKQDVVLVLVGEGVEKKLAQKMVREMDLTSRVRFLETQIDPLPLFSVADLVALPSEKESFGLVALEAMACSLPVVATNTGGLPEVVSHGETGLLVPVNNSFALASAMRRLLDDHELHRCFSAAARRRAEQFATAKIVPQYEALYLELLKTQSEVES